MQTLILDGKILRGEAMPGILKDFQAAVVGRKIVAAGYLKDTEGEFLHPCLLLDDQTLIMSAADDEGNGPGVLHHYSSPIPRHTMLCETEEKS